MVALVFVCAWERMSGSEYNDIKKKDKENRVANEERALAAMRSVGERRDVCVKTPNPGRGMVDPPSLSRYRSRCTLHQPLQAKRFSCRG